jgi:hypothetical protein
MNGTNAFNMKDNFLPSLVRFARAMEAQLASPCVKAKKTVFRERLIFVRKQSDNISVKRDYRFHIFDKKYNAAQLHLVPQAKVL